VPDADRSTGLRPRWLANGSTYWPSQSLLVGEPRMLYMHVHAHGSPMTSRRKVKPAIDLIGKGREPAGRPRRRQPRRLRRTTLSIPRSSRRSWAHAGEQSGAVERSRLGRARF